MSKREYEVVDFDADPNLELGDTHLTCKQIAVEAGVAVSSVHYHKDRGRLKECTWVQIASSPGGALAVAYDVTVHGYIQEPYSQGPKQEMDTEAVIEALQTQSPREVAEDLDVKTKAVQYISRRHSTRTPSWKERMHEEQAYAKQEKAKQLAADGADKYDIAVAMEISARTVEPYLRSVYPMPRKIPGRTPVWEQPVEKHKLWPKDA